MKTKKLEKKLELGKTTVSNLSHPEMRDVLGGFVTGTPCTRLCTGFTCESMCQINCDTFEESICEC